MKTERKISPTTLRLIGEKRKLATMLNAVLLYHSPGWDDLKEQEYKSMTAGAETTTKGLCDAIKRDLKDTGFDPWPPKE